ncbi:hypothetical protein O1611_g4603 [Lasiodiplodia mahajangana]|uniref:Uncharacterized protein n=1 Tax=Lasiodiplodia mahajangana TaxID=1108764 RepID=A0ACC2JNN8_9PEZI|nr:hypothetical protein O1611_g4603 [Lasiodiplodia mahajangana]
MAVGCRGLQFWSSFERNPKSLKSFLQLPVSASHGWKPQISPWDRSAGSDIMLLILCRLSITQRANLAFDATPEKTALIGASATISSSSIGNYSVEDEKEGRIVPDLLVPDGVPEEVRFQ